MKRFVLTFLCSIFFLQLVLSQQITMSQIFAEMPDSICPLLSKNDRLDCLDFIKSKMKAQVTNKLEGTSELKVLEKDYLLLQLTSITTIEINLLSTKKGEKYISVITTNKLPAKESSINFYDTSFNKVKSPIAFPELNRFFSTSDTCSADRLKRAKKLLRDPWINVQFDKKKSMFVFQLSLNTLSKKERLEISPYLVDVEEKWKY